MHLRRVFCDSLVAILYSILMLLRLIQLRRVIWDYRFCVIRYKLLIPDYAFEPRFLRFYSGDSLYEIIAFATSSLATRHLRLSFSRYSVRIINFGLCIWAAFFTILYSDSLFEINAFATSSLATRHLRLSFSRYSVRIINFGLCIWDAFFMAYKFATYTLTEISGQCWTGSKFDPFCKADDPAEMPTVNYPVILCQRKMIHRRNTIVLF